MKAILSRSRATECNNSTMSDASSPAADCFCPGAPTFCLLTFSFRVCGSFDSTMRSGEETCSHFPSAGKIASHLSNLWARCLNRNVSRCGARAKGAPISNAVFIIEKRYDGFITKDHRESKILRGVPPQVRPPHAPENRCDLFSAGVRNHLNTRTQAKYRHWRGT